MEQEENKEAFKPLNAQQTIKKWFKFQKIHRSIPIPMGLSRDYVEPKSYHIMIQSVENIEKRPHQLTAKILLNLYDQKESVFFGRTYESEQITLIFKQETKTVSFIPVNAYFHMRAYNDPNILLVAEIVVFEKDENDAIINRKIIGWGTVPATQIGASRVNLKKGSCRVLSSKFKGTLESSISYLYMEIEEAPWFSSLRSLLPEGCLCGNGDEVLGTSEGVINDSKLTLLEGQVVFVQNLVLQVPSTVEMEVKNSVKRYREVKFKQNDDEAQIQITARRIVVASHNGWTFTNKRGMLNSGVLDEGKEEAEYRIAEFNGALDVSGVYGGILIVQLEYDASFLVTNMGRQFTTIYMGWFPLVVPTDINDADADFEEELIIGPGKTLNGKILLDLTMIELPLIITGKLSGQNKRDYGEPEGMAQKQLTKYMRNKNVEDENEIKNTEHDVEKIQKLEELIQTMQSERQKIQAKESNEYKQQMEELKKREEKYQNQLGEMQKKHNDELKKQTEQYEDLKKLVQELKSNQQQQFTNTAQQSLVADSILYDQSDLEKWRIIESMTSVPRKTFYGQRGFALEAQFGNKTISRADMAYYSTRGIQGLIGDEDPDETRFTDTDENRCIEYETGDTKQCSQVLLQFLGFKPRQSLINQVINPDYKPESVYTEEASVPNRIYFTVYFFDFVPFQTEPLVFENASDRRSFQETLRNGQPLVFTREAAFTDSKQYKEAIYRFEVEPSQAPYPNQFQIFSRFLFKKCIFIEMWDCESQMLFGTIKVPLRGLLRQHRTQASITRQVDILSPNLKKVMGQLTLIIKNIGKNDQIQEKLPLQTTMKLNPQTKRKVISTQGIMSKTLLSTNITLAPPELDKESRIKERIRRFKISKFQDESLTEEQLQQSAPAKLAQLKEINNFKEQKRNALVRSVLQEHISEEKIIHGQLGKAEYIVLDFKNPAKTYQTFTIILEDPDYLYTNIAEFTLVSNPTEWKYLVSTSGYQQPFEYNMMTTLNSPTQYSFFLNEEETVQLIFKVIFYREPDSSITQIQQPEDIISMKGNDYIKKFCYPRTLGAFINITESGQTIGGTRIKFFPHFNYIDHIYRFYERDNHKVRLEFPPVFAHLNLTKEAQPLLYATDSDIQIEWNTNDEGQKVVKKDITIQDTLDKLVIAYLRVPEVKKQLNFKIMAYGDSYKKDLVAIWGVQVTALSGFSLEVPVGQVQASKLTIHTENARQVKFYSSHPLTVWFPPPFDRNYSLTPGKINIISISIRQFSEQITRVMITCVDIVSRELVYSWVLNIAPTVPPVSQVFDIKCPSDRQKNFILPYTNKLNQETTLTFVSSHPELLQIQEPKVQFKPLEKQDIRLRLSRVGEIKNAEIKLYIGDEDEGQDTYDCLLFRVKYVE